MASHLVVLCFDANDPRRLARFWTGVLGWEIANDPDEGLGLLPSDDTGLRIRFASTEEPKAGQNQMHLDLTSTSLEDQRQTVARSLGLGARHIDIGQCPEEGHVVLADPEGNEFCATTSLLIADSSERLRATVRRRSGTSGAKRWAGSWSGTETRRRRSARRAAVRRSRGAVRH